MALGRLSEVLEGEPSVEPRRYWCLLSDLLGSRCRRFWTTRSLQTELADLHPLRESGTRNYLWWIYERLEDLRPLLVPVNQ